MKSLDCKSRYFNTALNQWLGIGVVAGIVFFFGLVVGAAGFWLLQKVQLVKHPDPCFVHWPNLAALALVGGLMLGAFHLLTRETKN